jgi:hypothetical protein
MILIYFRTSITDKGLEALGMGPIHQSLQELRVDRCYKITDDGIEAILVKLLIAATNT